MVQMLFIKEQYEGHVEGTVWRMQAEQLDLGKWPAAT